MSQLKTEYTDSRNVTHLVEHLTVSAEGEKSREQIVEELLAVLTRKDRKRPA